ncbi:MAG: FKBP-type peptidyl-prolyl cis-trans isomerase [Gammaproteobacteria bacterium]|nr:FKBP-type peptidyl-prolyl cis-trans isomerase [Gammaproteobacteria bacterium]
MRIPGKLTRSTILAVAVLVGLLTGCGQPVSEEPAAAAIAGELAQASYTLGYAMGESLLAQYGDGLDIDVFTAGAEDGLRRNERQVAEADGTAGLDKLLQRRQAQLQATAVQVSDDGKQFLKANGTRSEVVSLSSGLQYEVLIETQGPKPVRTDTVTTHYEGTLIDGTVFDSSVQRGEPASFPVDRVIRGWTEALQRMSVGSKWRLFIPPDLAYGERGAPPSIPANATLIFDVELLSID